MTAESAFKGPNLVGRSRRDTSILGDVDADMRRLAPRFGWKEL